MGQKVTGVDTKIKFLTFPHAPVYLISNSLANATLSIKNIFSLKFPYSFAVPHLEKKLHVTGTLVAPAWPFT